MRKIKLLLTLLMLMCIGVTQMWGELPTNPKWVATAFADIADNATVIIISNSTTATNIALPAAGAGNSNPPKVACTVTTTDGVSTIAPPEGKTLQDLAWTIKKKTSTWQFFVEGSTTNCLYLNSTTSNTALRVGNGSSDNEFVMGDLGKLLKVSTATRFVGPYDNNGSDWRTYGTENATNYKGATLTFYVLQATPSCTSEITISKADDPSEGKFELDNSGKVCIDEGNATVNVTATPNAGYHLATVTSTVGTVGTISNNACQITGISANTTISVAFEADPAYTVSFNVGGSTATVNPKTEASAGAGITLPAGPTPTCASDGWEFAGWAAAAVGTQTTTAPTLLSGTYNPTANVTLYAVYKKSEGAVFDGTEGGDFYIYAEISGTKYYATAFAKKPASTTDVNSAVKYTFEKIVEDNKTYFAIKSGNAYLSYGTSGTDFTFTGTDPYKWEPAAGTQGSWRLKATTGSGRSIVYRAGTVNAFAPYASSNVNGTEYYDVEIGGGTTYYLSAPSCTTKTLNSITISGDAATKEYEPGSAFNVAGLDATANYSDDSHSTVTATWTISTTQNGEYLALDAEGAKLTAGTTSVWVKATYEDKTSAAYQVTGLSVKNTVTDEQLAWSAASGTVTMEATDNEYPSLTNSLGLTITYQSTNEDAATIDSNGDITLVAAGETTIKAVFAGNATYKAKTVSYTLTVNPAPVAVTGVSLNKSSLTLTEGANETLVATVAPNDATNKTVSWSSSAEGVATVDANGKVVAVAEGEATITVTTTDGEFKATCTVTVEPAVNYVKVTTAPSDWSGEYLIVYEGESNLAFNGGLSTIDAVGNTIVVTISEDKILSDANTEAAKFIFASMDGGYSIKAGNGQYIGATSYANGLAVQDEAIANTLSLDASGNAVLGVDFGTSGIVTLRYNKASDQRRFRYYKTGQQAIQLYRKSVSSAVTVTNPGHGTITVKAGEEAIGAKVQNGTVLTASIANVAGYRFALKAYKTSDVNTVVAIDNEGKLTMPAYPITITADETPLYTVGLAIVAKDKNDNVQEGAQGNTATINGGSADVIVAATDSIALVATPAAGYDFVNWTSDQSGNIAFRGDNASAANTKAVASANMTITANFKKKPCTALGTPVVTADISYISAKLTWEAVSNADKYVVIFNGVEQDASSNTYFDATGLTPETKYTYQVKALAAANQDDYCDGQFSTEANFTTIPLPKASLTLNYPSGTHASSGEYTILTPFNLPNAAAVTGCPKTFVGWDANPECATAPTYAPGASFTFADETPATLYAVYADLVSEGSTSYNKTDFEDLADGDVIVITNDNYAISNSSFGSNDQPNAVAVTVANNAITSSVEGLLWDITMGEENFSLAVHDGSNKLYCNGENNGVRVGTSTDYSSFSISSNYLYNTGRGRYLGVYQSTEWRCYTSINNNISGQTLAFYKQVSTPAVYENYSTACEVVVATPTISGETSFLDKTTVTLNCATEGATIKYSIDGTDPSLIYSEPFDLEETATVKAIAVKENWTNSAVAEQLFTKIVPMTVAEARAAIDANEGTENAYVTGVISQVDSYSDQYKSITYWISADGTSTNALKVYGGLGINGADFSSISDVTVGDSVVVTGDLSLYNSSIYQFNKNNQLVSYVAKELKNIAVKTAPTKVTYKEDDHFDPAGLVITAAYTVGQPQDIAYEGNESAFSFEPALTEALTASEEAVVVTITYGGKTATQEITVNAKQNYIVTITTPENGSVVVKNGENEIESGVTEILEGTTLTIEATPAKDYAVDKIYVNGEVIEGNTFELSAATTVNVTFKSQKAYTVSFNTGEGNSAQADIKESEFGAGIDLPDAPTMSETCVNEGWTFAGWATAAVTTEQAEAPAMLNSEEKYYPTDDITLYAVYQKGDDATSDSKTFTFSAIAEAEGWENSKAYTPVVVEPVTVAALGGGNNAKWYTTDGGSWRMYSGGTVQITVASGSVKSVTSSPTCDFTISDGVATFSPSARTDFTSIEVGYTVPSTKVYLSSPECVAPQCEALGTPVVEVADADITHNSAKLTWAAVDNAAKYAVKIGENEAVETTDLFYVATELEAETEYAYQVKALAAANQDAYCDGEYTEVANFTTKETPAPVVTVNFKLFSGELVEGDYVIYYDGKAMKNTVASDRLEYAEVTPAEDKIENPVAAIIWHIAQSGEYWTIYNAAVNAYAASTGVKNKAQLLADGTDDKSLWTVSGDATYDIVNKANAASEINAYLRNNGTYGFACYAEGTGGALSLYKMMAPTHTVAYTVGENGSAVFSVDNNAEVEEGETVTITPTADQNYRVKAVTVRDGNDQEVTVVESAGVYSFVMPQSNVEADVQFEYIPVNSVSVAATLSMVVAEEQTLTATVLPAEALATVTWESNNTDVATVDANGKVTAVAAGQATIKATSTVTTSAYGECVVTISAAIGHAITITQTEGGTVTANVNPADVSADAAVTLTATPANGYTVSGWTIEGVEEEALTISEDKTTCSFVMPDDEVLAEVSFTHETASLILHDANSVTTLDGDHFWKEAVTLPTEAAECSKTFVGWSANAECTTADDMIAGATYVLPNKGENHIYAVYADVAEVVTWDEITTVPEAGEYAICSADNFMTAVVSNSRLANGDVAPEIADNKLSVAPAANCIWEVSINDGKYLFKNGTNYAAANGTKNQGALSTDATDAKSQWTVVYDNGFVVTNVHNAANNVNAVLRNNGEYGWAAYGASTGSAPRFFKKNITAGAASNYSTECAAIIPQPTAVATPASVEATADAVAQTTIAIVYENVKVSDVTMGLYSNAECTTAFAEEWLTASLDDNKQVVYSIAENTSYNNAREAYIKVVAPQTDNLTEAAVVIIPVSQAKKAAVFASLEDLVAADVAANTNVTVSFADVVIKEIYMYNSNRRGLVFDIQKDEADIKIYFNADVPAAWTAGGKVSGTLTNCPWKTFSNAWQLAPASGWAWNNLTYTEPAAVKTVAITGGEPQKNYVDGEKFNPAGLTVRVTYTDDSYEDNPVGVTFSEATLAENQTSVEITATYNNVTSEAYTVTELTVGPIQVKGIAEFIAAGGMRCYLEGLVSNYTNTTKGYFDLTDATATIHIYGCTSPSSFEVDDKIKVIAEVYEYYQGTTHEAKNVEYVETLPQAVESVALDISEKAIFVEDQFTLTATIAPAKATNKAVTWSSSDDAIATVVDGVVTGVAAGEATITATSVADNTKTATCAVTVSEAERNTLTLMVNGGVYRSIKALVGASVWDILGSITDPDIAGYNFKGWSLTEAEEVLTEGTAGTLDADMTLYAVYAKGNVTYVKVTETSAITSGQYLIVYEGDNSHDAVAFNGALETLEAASNTIPVTINEGVINGNNSTNMAEFTIGSTGTIRSKSGYYIGRNANSNGMNVDASEQYTHTFSIDDSGNAVITSSGNPTLRYNYASDNLRFRYYKSGQQAIALYKRTDGAEGEPISTPTITVEENEVINVSDVAAEGVPVSIVVENGGTMNIDQTTIATNITAKDGATINVNEETTAENIVVENGGKIVTNAPTTTPTVYFATTMGAADNNGDFHGVASELGGVTNITLAQGGEIIYDLTLGTSKAGVQADPSHWHAFSLPFQVDAINGIYDAETGLKLTNEVNYAIMDYHGDIRANGDYGWKKYRGILQPGTFYLMTVDGNTTTFRFKATQAGQMDQTNSMSAKAYDGTGADTDKGWNGFGNPRWIEGAFGHDAQYLDPYTYEYITIIPGMTIPVGLPFFYKASTTSDVQMDEVGTTYAPARSKAYEIKNVAVRFGNEESKDKLYISASEDALNEYEQDKDLVKMFMSQTPNVARISGKAYGMKLAKVYAPMVNDQAEYSLTLYAPQAGEYTISVSEVENADIYLTHEGTIIWNLSMGAYTNDFAKGNTEGYGLIMVKKAPSVATGVDSAEANEAGVQKVIIEDKVFILRGGQMYDVTGKMVK